MARRSTRDEILAVSARLFAHDGFKGTSLNGIATEVGCSKATLLYHFAGKEAILLALLEPVLAPALALDARLAGLGPADVQVQAIDGFIDLVLAYRSEVALIYPDPALLELPALAGFAPLADQLCAAFAARSTDPADLVAAQVVLAGVCAVALEHPGGPDPALRAALIRVARRALITT